MTDLSNDYGLYISDFGKMNVNSDSQKVAKTFYTLYIVSKGEGFLAYPHVSYKISKGDIFMTLPHQGYRIESERELACIYIEFMGTRGVELSKGLMDYSHTPIFTGYAHMIDFLQEALERFSKIKNKLIAEGALLYILGSIPGKGALKGEYKKRESIMIQTYIRSNFNNADLSLESVARTFGYNKKYLSDLFKRKFDITFTEFLKKVRLENAASLMQLGNTSVSRISTLCGYSDPLYFSKQFKEKYAVSPKHYIAGLSEKK